MVSDPKPAPTAPFLKGSGKWSYYVYPQGAPEEGGEFLDENSAKQSFIKMYRLWEANGQSYQGNIAILN